MPADKATIRTDIRALRQDAQALRDLADALDHQVSLKTFEETDVNRQLMVDAHELASRARIYLKGC